MKVIILVGGSGTRLWPLSRKTYPKQFLKFGDNKSLLAQTVERVLNIVSPKDIVIVTNKEYKFYVELELKNNDINNIIPEPISRNTAPAIALAVKYCMENLKCKKDETIAVLPSDHIIKESNNKFSNYVKDAEKLAKKGYIVTFGIIPKDPETGYGYIRVDNKTKYREGYFKVHNFIEKPNKKIAQKYIKAGNYYWNSGMFAFSIDTIIKEFKRFIPEIDKELNKTFIDMIKDFKLMPNISIDYAVMEKSSKVVMLPLQIYWNDIGSWDALYNIFDKDEFGNAKIGDIVSVDTKNSLIMGHRKIIATIGLEDCIVIDTGDAILISKKGQTQKVKNIATDLIKANRKESLEHLTTIKPWGNYTILEERQGYKIKRIIVNPKQKLSLQMHYHRSEHWVVVNGTAKVRVGEKDIFIHPNESIYVPRTTLHRLENPGKTPLEIIEVQNGEYLREDDIVRIEDAYGR